MSTERGLVSVIIPSYNSKHLLGKYLPALLDVGMYEGHIVEILIIDDASTDGTRGWVRREFEWAYSVLRVISYSQRRGFARATNHGVRIAKGTYVLLLNTDVEILPGAISALYERIQNAQDIFSVSPFVHYARGDQWGDVYQAQAVPKWRLGHLSLHTVAETIDRCVPSLYTCGGAGLFHRGMFLHLGGFDPIYAPLYCEDVDLGWRAWRAGWRVLYEPRAHMLHHHQGTVSRMYTPRALQRAGARNTLLLTWMCLRDKRRWAAHVAGLPLWLLAAICTGHVFAPAFVECLRMIPTILHTRLHRALREVVRDDRHIFAAVQETGEQPREGFLPWMTVENDGKGRKALPWMSVK